MSTILNVLHLEKEYPGVKAVDGATFFIERGHIFGLLGPNGAGKTTTINIIAQILEPDSGSVEIDGMDLKKHSKKIKSIVGLVTQELAIYPKLTGRENLAFFGRLYDIGGKALKDRIGETLELIGLKDAADRRAETYSGGMKRRLNIGVGMMNHPKLLVLDEPAVGVDPQSRNHILESIRYIRDQYGITILYTSHYMEEVQAICDRAAIIDKGKIIADNTIKHLIETFGMGSIVIKLEQDDENIPHYLAEGIKQDTIHMQDGFLTISVNQPHMILPKVLEKLNDHQVKLETIEINRSDLETVFLNLTGRSLRDQ